jgi:hypothetical protein
MLDGSGILNNVDEPGCITEVRPQLYLLIIIPEGPAPSRPTPGKAITGKKVAEGSLFPEQEVVSRNMHHPFIIAVSLQQLLAKAKERRMWDTIVFQNNGLLDLTENPRETCGWTPPAAQIYLRIILYYFTLPIHPLDNGTGGSASLSFTWFFRARAVGDDEQSSGTSAGDFSEDTRRNIGTVEYDERYRSAHG